MLISHGQSRGDRVWSVAVHGRYKGSETRIEDQQVPKEMEQMSQKHRKELLSDMSASLLTNILRVRDIRPKWKH